MGIAPCVVLRRTGVPTMRPMAPTPCSSQLTLRGCGQGWGVGQGLQAATVGGGGLRVGGWLDGWWVDESLVSACSSDPP